jgi:hypothetical protein
VLENVEAVAGAAGGGLPSIVKGWLGFASRDVYHAAIPVWHEAFGDQPPARSILVPPSPLPIPECSMTFDLIGYAP